MRSRALALRLILPAGLVVLVGVLAALEYRWLGQVSEADRERRHASLQQHAEEFADDFDRELLRLYLVLQSDSGAIQEGHVENFARHLDAWREAARDPRILRAVYLVDGDPPKLRLREFHSDTKMFVDAAWPAALALVHTQMAAVFPDNTGAGPDKWFLMPHDPVAASVPALIVNLSSMPALQRFDPGNLMSFGHTTGFIIGLIDQDVLRSSILPALAERYFPARDADSYRLEIIDTTSPAQPVLSRGLVSGAALDPKKADADVPLFSLRFDLASQVVSRAVYTTDLNGTAARDVTGKRLVATPAAPRVNSAPRMTSGGAGGGAARGTVSAFGAGGRGAGGTISAAAGGRSTGRNEFQIVVQTSDRPNSLFAASRSPLPPWHLVLQHSAGSLDEAVNQARRRNLWLSFGILGVLGVGVALIMVNAQRSERLAAQQMDFVATVSHELRTPLAVILSAAQNLSAGVVLDAAQAKKYGDVIDAEGRRLTGMVEQVLEYAGLSGGRRPLMARPVDLEGLARDVLDSCEPLLPAAHFDVQIDADHDLSPVAADEGAIRRALQNLITNALKYGADGRWLGVSLRKASARGRDEVQITVADRGRGIDAADLPHIFDAFYRGRRAVDEQIHGNGLGLSLVKRIAEAHGGRVTVKSAPGEGTAFTLHLPAADGEIRTSDETHAASLLAHRSPEELGAHSEQ